jgi:hypothetical protein
MASITASPPNFVEHQPLNVLPMEAHLYERLREVEVTNLISRRVPV